MVQEAWVLVLWYVFALVVEEALMAQKTLVLVVLSDASLVVEENLMCLNSWA